MELEGEWFIWRHNPQTANNMGVERKQQTRSARSILAALLKQYFESLDNESWRKPLVK